MRNRQFIILFIVIFLSVYLHPVLAQEDNAALYRLIDVTDDAVTYELICSEYIANMEEEPMGYIQLVAQDGSSSYDDDLQSYKDDCLLSDKYCRLWNPESSGSAGSEYGFPLTITFTGPAIDPYGFFWTVPVAYAGPGLNGEPGLNFANGIDARDIYYAKKECEGNND